MFVPHIICCFGVKGIKVYLKRCSDYIFFLQRALSAERQVESLREELVAAQNALQVCSTFVSISNSIYRQSSSKFELSGITCKLFATFCYNFISEWK